MTTAPGRETWMGIAIALVSSFVLLASGCGLMSWPAVSGVGAAMAILGFLVFVVAGLVAVGAAVVGVISLVVNAFQKGAS